MIEPAVLPLVAYRNGVVREEVTFTLGGSTQDITGWTVRMQIRPKAGATGAAIVDITTTAPNAAGSVITLTTPAAGKFAIYITNSDLQDSIEVPAGSDYVDLVYDIVLTRPNGDFFPYIKGGFRLYEGVTR